MSRYGSIKFQVGKILTEGNHIGIGESKKLTREQSGLKGQNGHNVSDKFHSYKSLDNVRRDLQNLGNFAKETFNIKNITEIDKDVVREWILHKDITYNTASNYLSELNKLSEHFAFTRADIRELREEFRENLKENVLESRAYDPERLEKVELPTDKLQVAFELQRDYGLRASEATKINVEKNLNGNELSYQQKGGMWSKTEINKELADKIRANANEKIFRVPYTTYRDNLRKEIQKNGMRWNGTHGIRHSFAQQKLEEGYSKAEVSAMMGHVREEITNTYLR